MLEECQPGQFICILFEPSDADKVGFSLRRHNANIRNTVSIFKPSDHLFAALAQIEFPNSYHEHIVRTGVGMLHIDAGRVSVDENDPNMRPNARNHDKTENWHSSSYGIDATTQDARDDLGYHSSKGRFPANFLIVHGSKCEKQEDQKGELNGWRCQANCPARLLNQQSGFLKVRGNTTPTTRNQNQGLWASYGAQMGVGKEGSVSSGDSGGASRYFKQLSGQDHLLSYLSNLIGSSDHIFEVG